MLGTIFGLPVFSTTTQNSAATGLLGTAGQAGSAYQANQQASNAHAQAMAQQQMAQYNAAMMRNQHRYMINGRTMTWDEWLDELAPGDDNPQRTFLTLKYKGIDQ